jgi:hypothetical protein
VVQWPLSASDAGAPGLPKTVSRIVVVVLAVLLLVGCSTSSKDSDLYGAYLATYENGTEKLTLERDGTFIQEVRLDGSDEAVVNLGTWR